MEQVTFIAVVQVIVHSIFNLHEESECQFPNFVLTPIVLKKPSMEEGSQVKKYPIAIQFLGTYVIVMGVI